MYEGQQIICKDIVEEHWVEFLTYNKKRMLAEQERHKKRQAALAEIDLPDGGLLGQSNIAVQKMMVDEPRYYDISLGRFWDWYIAHKI